MAFLKAIPIEIMEFTLDFLHDDFKTLCSSSLVCRSWLLTTRYHLFNRLVLLRYRTGIIHRGNIDSFILVAKSPRCTILPVIRTLVLRVDLVHKSDQIQDVLKILTPCPALTTLELVDGSRSYKVQPQISWIANVLPGIRDLTFSSRVNTPDDAYRLSASFPELRALSFDVRYCPQGPLHLFPSEVSGANFSGLRTLHLSIADSELFIDSFMNLRDWKPQLETFDLRVCGSSHDEWRCGDALNVFLKANDSTLVNLSLSRDFRFSSDADDGEY